MTPLAFIKRAFLAILLIYGLISLLHYYWQAPEYSLENSTFFDDSDIKDIFDEIEESRLSCPSICPSLINGENVSLTTCPKHEDENNHKLYTRRLQNCSSFINENGFLLHSMTEEEETYPLAFSLIVYCNPYQIELLLRAIYRPQNVYCLHVDLDSKESFKTCMHSLADCFPNVFVAERSELVTWGTFGVVAAELSCMKDLLRYKRWKYFINLTGQEFPLKTNLEIVRILTALHGANDINAKVDPTKYFRIQNIYDKDGKALRRHKPPPFNMTVLSGSTHISATRGFVDFVINNRKSKVYIEWVNGTKIPDETIFSMLNGNPQLGVPGSYKGSLATISQLPHISRYKVWEGEHNGRCGGFFRRGVCIFSVKDLPNLTSRPQLFANKFAGVNPHDFMARHCLDEWLFNRTKNEYLGRFSLDYRPYQFLPQAYP